MTISNGNVANADELMNAIGSNFNDTAQNIFNADYIGFDSRLSNNTIPTLKNVFYSTFTSDDADEVFQFFYDSVNDLYIAPDLSVIGTEYVIIEATSFNETWTNGDNDTFVFPISSGKWLIYCDTGTDAVQRAQIIKSLFSDNLILDFTSVTAVKTTHSEDIGKQAHSASLSRTSTSGSGEYTGTFVDTSTNINCSSWSRCVNSGGANDELGTDTSSDENDNPAECQLQVLTTENNASWEIPTGTVRNAITGNSSTRSVRVTILCFGDITWVETGTVDSSSDIDFFTTHSIPLMIAADTLSNEGIGDSTLIFKDTVPSTDNVITVINSQIDAANSEQISISANGGSNFTDVNNTEIARPIAGTELWRKIVITRTDLSKEDKVTEQAVKHSFY